MNSPDMTLLHEAPSRPRRWIGWPFNIILLAVIGIPAFSGYPLGRWPAEIIHGVAWSDTVYWVLVLASARCLLGRRMFANIIAVAAMVSLPVVFAGGVITWMGSLFGLTRQSPDAAGAHYVALCLTMITVIPLALAMVVLVPFSRFEQRMLLDSRGVSLRQKKTLMVLRVFNHIAFTVLPGTLEILREERLTHPATAGNEAHRPPFPVLLRRTMRYLIFIGVGTICASLQYIPLWAYEIGKLPEKGPEH
jgi:hypothetical protein